jgi:CheY-like chemotaxis protein
VLIVEDNMFNQKIAQIFLEQLGCRVDLAANGREALELLALRPYGLVFMDCEMPEMDGFEATGEIRRRYAGHHIPIIAMTATAQPDERERCLAAGMDDYLPKPVRIEALAGALTRWVPVAASEPLNETEKSLPQAIPEVRAEGDRAVVLDPTTLQRLKSLARMMEEAWFTRLLEKFQNDAVADISAMRQALAEGDWVGLSHTAHRLSGASLNIGAHEMGDTCRRLEELDRTQTSAAVGLVTQLEREFSRVQAEIEQELNR